MTAPSTVTVSLHSGKSIAVGMCKIIEDTAMSVAISIV